mgnify:CR=1 FL=1
MRYFRNFFPFLILMIVFVLDSGAVEARTIVWEDYRKPFNQAIAVGRNQEKIEIEVTIPGEFLKTHEKVPLWVRCSGIDRHEKAYVKVNGSFFGNYSLPIEEGVVPIKTKHLEPGKNSLVFGYNVSSAGGGNHVMLGYTEIHFEITGLKFSLGTGKQAEVYTAPAPVKDDTIPPIITITSPTPQRGIIRFKKETIRVRGAVSDENGVSEITVNGAPAIRLPEDRFEGLVALSRGDNTILIQARDPHDNLASKTITIHREKSSFTPQPASPKPSVFQQPAANNELEKWYGRQFALVVGIDHYRDRRLNPLNNAINDAKAVAKMLRELGFDVIERYDEEATRREIVQSFSDIQRKIGKSDGFVFYFAGHGQGVRLGSGDLIGYIIPYDAALDLSRDNVMDYDEEAISLNRLRNYSKDMDAKHVALLLDSCFSGLAMKRSAPTMPRMTRAYYNDLLDRKAINILTAGDDHPVSDGSGHSPFTQAILNGLGRKNIDLLDRDGYATFTQLAVYVKEKVEKATGRRQRPQFDNLSMDDGDFIFKLR